MGDLVNATLDAFGLGPASKQSQAVTQAAETGAGASRYAADVQREMFNRSVALQEPFRQAGINALTRMQQQYANMPEVFTYKGNMPAAFTGQVKLGEDPGYAFRLSEGQKALDRQAAARGGLISGGALKAAQRYGQEMGSQEYGNAYNRALTNYNAAVNREATGYNRALTGYNAAVNREGTGYNRLAAMSGIGQTATGNLSSLGQSYGNTMGNLALTGGANQANALLQQGNIAASQYGTLGRGIGQLYDIGNQRGWWNSSPSYNYGSFGGGSGTFGEGEY
jgi:hypothetical protein